MATEGPLGSFINEEGLRRSARFTNLETALQNNNEDAVIKLALEDASEALQSVGTGGSRRKMRGGTIDQALAEAAEGLKNAGKGQLSAFNQAIEDFIRSTPDLYRNYSGVAAKGLALTTVLNYPTPFANIAAALIKLIPVPSGATWGVYSNAVGTLASALSQVGIKIGSSALTGPVLIGLFALYVQNKRAEVNNIPTWKVFVNDGKAIVYAVKTVAGSLSGLIKEQVDAFTKAFAKPTPSKSIIDALREVADNLQQEPTLELAGNIEGFEPVLDKQGNPVLDEEGNQLLRPVPKKAPKVKPTAEKQPGPKNPKLQQQLATRKKTLESYGFKAQERRENTAAANLEAAREAREAAPTPSKTGSEGSSAAPSAFMSPPPTASSSMTDAEMIVRRTGGRRKTRKPKKIRRITRRFRRHFAY